MKGGTSPSKLLDKDELKVDLDSFSHHGEQTLGDVKLLRVSKPIFLLAPQI
jgi:hypothetical protein